METWPTFLPLPSLAFSTEEVPAVSRTTMESGRTRQRRRFTTNVMTCQARWSFDAVHYAVFQSWKARRIGGGADPFLMQLNLGDGLTTYEMHIVNGVVTSAKEDPRWIVTASIELQDPAVLSEEVLEFILLSGYDLRSFLSSVESLHEYIHTFLPDLWET